MSKDIPVILSEEDLLGLLTSIAGCQHTASTHPDGATRFAAHKVVTSATKHVRDHDRAQRQLIEELRQWHAEDIAQRADENDVLRAQIEELRHTVRSLGTSAHEMTETARRALK